MKKSHSFYICLVAFSCGIIFSSFVRNSTVEKFTLPYKKAGLTEQQAAAHLLSRFTYGAKAGDVDAVVKEGLEKWFVQQLDGKQDNANLNQMLARFEDINLTNTEVENLYPRNAQVVRFAVKDGVIHKDSVNKANGKEYREQILAYMKTKGFKPQQELYRHDMQMGGNAQQQQRRKKFQEDFQKKKLQLGKGKSGLNENYAREVMELHTLGVDGGYTQSDVTQAARVLTGWTIAPMGDNGYGAPIKKLMETVGKENLTKRGYVLDGDFIFAMNRHDNGEKVVLGKKFPAGGGYEEGVELLKMLAHHQSTAKFISKKLATRFVNDNPPQSLIDKMAKTFLSTDGDIKSVLITMASSPEFWSKEALREKTKSPFELAISAVRSLDAKVNQPYQLYTWINKMGQQMYYYQAPTGFPDKGQYWINTGSLLNRMNFGLALASQRIPGITFSLAKMNNNHEPESAEAALTIYSKLFMPERKLDETIARLKPMLNDPNLEKNVANAAQKSTPPQQMNTMANEDANIMD
ncbi:MAG: DUF1800 domain-containing protein, partial [Pedobacter sp.]